MPAGNATASDLHLHVNCSQAESRNYSTSPETRQQSHHWQHQHQVSNPGSGAGHLSTALSSLHAVRGAAMRHRRALAAALCLAGAYVVLVQLPGNADRQEWQRSTAEEVCLKPFVAWECFHC